MTDDALRLAIIGCGAVAQRHLLALAELRDRGLGGIAVTALCDTQDAAARGLAREVEARLGVRPVIYTDHRELLRRGAIDAVDICLPHGLHHGAAIAWLEAGVHVLCEKPLGITVRASRRMAEVADRTGCVLATAVPYRRLIGQRTARWILRESGLIGAPLTFFHQYTRAPRPQPAGPAVPPAPTWRQERLMSGGGPVMDSGFHYCDSIRYLLGDVEKVYAELREVGAGVPRTLAETREDTAFVTLTFKNGVVGMWSWSMAAPGAPLGNVVFYGSEGSLHDTSQPGPSIFHLFWRNPGSGLIESGEVTRRDGTTRALEDLERLYLDRLGEEERETLFPRGTMDGFAIEIWDFVEAIRGHRAKPEVDGWEGLQALAICEAAYESAYTGEAVRVDAILSGERRAYQRPIDEHWDLD